MVVQMLGYKFSWVLSWVGVWKYQVQEKKILKKCWIPKNVRSKKNLGIKKFWVLKNFGFWKILGSEKFWVPKNFESLKILGSEKFWVQKNFWVPYKIWLSKNFQKYFGFLKKILDPDNSGSWKFLGPEKFGSWKFFGPDMCLEDHQCPSKVGFHVGHEFGSETVREWIRRWVGCLSQE